jgi:NADH:ubiquinone oxidoreductase subunit E
VECLGSCGTAPVMMVNGVSREHRPRPVAALLEALDSHDRP